MKYVIIIIILYLIYDKLRKRIEFKWLREYIYKDIVGIQVIWWKYRDSNSPIIPPTVVGHSIIYWKWKKRKI